LYREKGKKGENAGYFFSPSREREEEGALPATVLHMLRSGKGKKGWEKVFSPQIAH